MDRNSFIKSRIFFFSLFLIIGIMINVSDVSGQPSLEIPSWLKNTAKYWAEDSISDEEFVQAIQWLINEDVISIPQQGGSTQQVQDENAPPGVFSNIKCTQGYQYMKMTGRYTNGDIPYSIVSLKMAVLDVNGDVLSTGSGLLTNVQPRTTKYFDAIAIFAGEEYDSCEIEVSSAIPTERFLENKTLRPIIIEVLKDQQETDAEEATEEPIETPTDDSIKTPTEEINTESYSISQIRTGLVVSDPLNNGKVNDYWIFGGSAESVQAPYDHFTNADGLNIGVQAPASGIYAGHFAMVPPTNGTLFHSVITTPRSYISEGYLQNGLYVQGSDGTPNYVTCVSIISESGKPTWAVTRTYVDAEGISKFEVLWSDENPKPSLTRDCSIITNGNNFLRVYLDNAEVYVNYDLDLQMTGPFLSFLETQSSYPGEKLYGTFNDFYITLDATIQVVNVPDYITKVALTDTSNNILAEGIVNEGTSIIDIAELHYPISGNIKAFQNSREIISTSSPVIVFGGDIYSVDSN